jgi:hypothetical protein
MGNRLVGRRYEEVADEQARHNIDGAKAALKRLGARERAYLLAWLCKYFSDQGEIFSPQITAARRRRIVLDGIEYWLVRAPQPPKRPGPDAPS